MQMNLRIYCNSTSKLKKEEITRYIWQGAVILKRNFGVLGCFFVVEAEPLDMRYQAEPGNELPDFSTPSSGIRSIIRTVDRIFRQSYCRLNRTLEMVVATEKYTISTRDLVHSLSSAHRVGDSSANA
jgi:hypothetical protein